MVLSAFLHSEGAPVGERCFIFISCLMSVVTCTVSLIWCCFFQDFIVSELGKLCDLYSEDIRNECQRLVNTYGKEIIDLLINEVESGVICDQLMLCVSSPKLTKVT